MPSHRPNADRLPVRIVLITTDQQRYDTLGVTGNRHIRTPHLDSLAQRGALFEQCIIQNPICIPSRACMQTGRYTHQHGVRYADRLPVRMETEIDSDRKVRLIPGLPECETTFMERLQAAGYHTAAFGKIHSIPPKGFDELQLTGGKGRRWTQRYRTAARSRSARSLLRPVARRTRSRRLRTDLCAAADAGVQIAAVGAAQRAAGR